MQAAKDNYFIPPKFVIEGAEDMMKKEYPPLEFLVESLLPKTSLVTLSANPKTGKSLWTEQLATIVSNKGTNEFVGHEVKIHGEVLLLALEDTPPRLVERLQKQSLDKPTNALHICTRWTSANEGGVKDLQVYLSQHPEVVLVVIDTLQHFRASAVATDYAEDYNWMKSLKKISDEKNICIVLVHHLRKTKTEGEDEINQISGSMGISGVADANIILERRRRSYVAEMKVSGRDMEDYAQKLRLSPETLTWSAMGDADSIVEEKITPERRAILEALKKLGGLGAPKQIADLLQKDNKVVGNELLLMLAAGQVLRSKKKHGFYILPDYDEGTEEQKLFDNAPTDDDTNATDDADEELESQPQQEEQYETF